MSNYNPVEQAKKRGQDPNEPINYRAELDAFLKDPSRVPPGFAPDIKAQIDAVTDPYWKQQLLNVYNSYSKQFFAPNLSQGIGEGLGIYTDRQNWENERLAGLTSDVQRIMEAMHQEKYDDPASQVARQRAAGVNTDLSGSVGAGEAGQIDQPDMTDPVLNEATSHFSDIANIGSTIISTALQCVSGFQSIAGTGLDLAMKDLTLNTSLNGSAWNIIKSATGEFINNGIAHDDSGDFVESLKSGKGFSFLLDAMHKNVDSLPYNSRNKKRLSAIIDRLINVHDSGGNTFTPSAEYQTIVNNLLSDLNVSRSKYTKSYGELGADHEYQDGMRFIADNIYRPLNEIQIQYETALGKYNSAFYNTVDGTLKAKRENAEHNYHYNYFNFASGYKRATAENTEYDLRADIRKIQQRITKSFEDINKKITGSSKLSPTWKVGLQAGVAAAEALAMSRLSIH